MQIPFEEYGRLSIDSATEYFNFIVRNILSSHVRN